jgi:hypothetical protein
MQVLKCLMVSKICIIPLLPHQISLYPQSDGMVEHYIKAVDEHVWEVFALN